MNQSNPNPPVATLEPDEKLNLDSILASGAFPGRTTLFVAEIAHALRVTKQHVVNLIDEGVLSAIDVSNHPPSTRKSASRRSFRIPVSSYDNYVRSRANY